MAGDSGFDEPRSGALGKIVVFGLLVAIIVLAARYLTLNEDGGTVKTTVLKYAAPAVEAANTATQEGRDALQGVMAGSDSDAANQALLKLCRSGAAGWDAVLEQLPDAPEAVQAKIKEIYFGDSRFEHCARAMESGTEKSKLGALIALDTGNQAIMNGGSTSATGDLRKRLFDSIAKYLPGAAGEAKELAIKALNRFAPTEFAEIKELAADKSAVLRKIAAERLGFSRDKGAMDALTAMKDDADASVRDAATKAIAQLKVQGSRRRQRG